jgi:hypothetical protein
MKTPLYLALLTLCAGCDNQPQAPTASENVQLNEAEDLLDDMADENDGKAS